MMVITAQINAVEYADCGCSIHTVDTVAAVLDDQGKEEVKNR